MKTTLIALLITASPVLAQDYHYVRPGQNKDGSYRDGYYRTNPDRDRGNNWSTQGNYNPFTGKEGTRKPDRGAGSGDWNWTRR